MLLKTARFKSISTYRPAKSGKKGKEKKVTKVAISSAELDTQKSN